MNLFPEIIPLYIACKPITITESVLSPPQKAGAFRKYKTTNN